jgi:hypothetical protein
MDPTRKAGFIGQAFPPGIQKAVDFAYQLQQFLRILLDGGSRAQSDPTFRGWSFVAERRSSVGYERIVLAGINGGKGLDVFIVIDIFEGHGVLDAGLKNWMVLRIPENSRWKHESDALHPLRST